MANRIVLEKISTVTPAEIRTARNVGEDKYEGVMFFAPAVGKSFAFYRDDKAYMHTSEVKSIAYEIDKEADSVVLKFKTRNSEYKLTIGDQQEPV